jgi:hypothetical protein
MHTQMLIGSKFETGTVSALENYAAECHLIAAHGGQPRSKLSRVGPLSFA